MRVLFKLIACTTLIYASNSWAGPAEALTALLSNMQTAKGQFEQSLIDVKGEQMQASQGNFLVKKPGMFLWLTQSPFPQHLVSNGSEVWLYDADLEQASVSKIDQDSQQTPALLLSGDAKKLQNNFTIVQAKSSDKNLASFELNSKQENAVFRRISATFNAGVLTRMSFVDKIGNTTQFTFDDVVLNTQLDNSLFEFVPPAGTDVIRND